MPKYEKNDYWKLLKQGLHPIPQDFGCPDYTHNEKGEIDFWTGPNPDAYPFEEDKNAVPLEKQHYQSEPERTQYENMRSGWSKMVDQGLKNDYWREYDEWN